MIENKQKKVYNVKLNFENKLPFQPITRIYISLLKEKGRKQT